MTETEEKLRGMGVTMDQRRRLMMASKLGLGPLGQLGFREPEGRSRSPVERAASPPSSSALVALAPGGHQVPAQNAELAKRRLADQAARANAISRGGSAVKAMTSAVVQAREDAEDLDSFLAGGRKMAVQAAKVMEDKKKDKKKLVIEQASQENLQKSADAAREVEAAREAEREREEAEERHRAEKRKREEERRREEEKQEERRRRKDEDKRRKREEKEKSKDSSSESEADRKEKAGAGLFKAVMKENETKRHHWGESVKGRVSSDYKGLTDAELERRFASPHGGAASEKLMTEQEVLAMLRKGKSKKK